MLNVMPILYIQSISKSNLVVGFNPSEEYWLNWIISPGRGEHEKYLKPPPSNLYTYILKQSKDLLENE